MLGTETGTQQLVHRSVKTTSVPIVRRHQRRTAPKRGNLNDKTCCLRDDTHFPTCEHECILIRVTLQKERGCGPLG